MSIKYLKIKPSEDFIIRTGIKKFEIEYLNLFSQKKELELHQR